MFILPHTQPAASFDSALLGKLGGERHVVRAGASDGYGQSKQDSGSADSQTAFGRLAGTAQSNTVQTVARAADTVTFTGTAPEQPTYSHLANCPAVRLAMTERLRRLAA